MTLKINFYTFFLKISGFFSFFRYLNMFKRKISKFLFWGIASLFFSVVFFSCISPGIKEEKSCSRKLLADGIKNENQLAEFFLSENPNVSLQKVKSLAKDYIQEAKTEEINSDVAFVQMCLETGFLRFGNLVKSEWHNYCGLGAIDYSKPGEKFPDQQTGVRAHIQHLQAYATTEDVKLKKALVDPRYNWVHKTKLAYSVFDLAGTWATDKNYGTKLDALLARLEQF